MPLCKVFFAHDDEESMILLSSYKDEENEGWHSDFKCSFIEKSQGRCTSYWLSTISVNDCTE